MTAERAADMAMPRPLRWLCLAFGFLLLLDIGMLAFGAFAVQEEMPEAWPVVVAMNAVAILISLVFLWLLRAFMRRRPHSRGWLLAVVWTNALLLGSFLFIDDPDPAGQSWLDRLEFWRSGLETGVCLALGLLLGQRSSVAWYAPSAPGDGMPPGEPGAE